MTEPTDAEIEALGHRMCWHYKHDTGVNHISTFTFNAQTLHDFARAVLAKWGADQRVSFDEVWDEALVLKKAAQAAPTTQPSPAVQGDVLDAEVLRAAERYRFIRDVPYSDDVRSVLVHQQNTAMDRVIDDARKGWDAESAVMTPAARSNQYIKAARAAQEGKK